MIVGRIVSAGVGMNKSAGEGLLERVVLNSFYYYSP